MSRIAAIHPQETQGKTREILGAVERMLGATPNLFRVTAQSPSALEGMVTLLGATSKGTLDAKTREAIALVVAEANGCDYCLSAHSYLAKAAGLSEADIDRARDASSSDARTGAILRFARSLVVGRGRIAEAELTALRDAGVSDAAALEIVSLVVLNIFTNYVNLVAGTDIDFPVVRSKTEE